ncbi:MAG TPA: AAA family ATPase, partial [Firmicutes bacterium]|nr:AAA family ATPase [Bacillota bacterium]
RVETDENDEEILVDVEDEELEKIQELLEEESLDGDFLDDDEDEDFLDDEDEDFEKDEDRE